MAEAATARHARTSLGGRAANLFRAWALGALADRELDTVTFAQIVDALAEDNAAVEEVVVSGRRP